MISCMTIDANGTIRYRNKDGVIHRIGGPAIEYYYGNKTWYVNGLLHREDGPAVMNADGGKYWWLNDVKYTYDEWLKLIPNGLVYKWKEYNES